MHTLMSFGFKVFLTTKFKNWQFITSIMLISLEILPGRSFSFEFVRVRESQKDSTPERPVVGDCQLATLYGEN